MITVLASDGKELEHERGLVLNGIIFIPSFSQSVNLEVIRKGCTYMELTPQPYEIFLYL